MRPSRVIVVDDHEIVRAGLRALLERETDIHVVATAATGEEGLALIEDVQPDIAVVDYSLPGMSGVELCEEITARYPGVAVIMLTTFLDDEVILRAVEAGARAYVYKDVEASELKRAIRTVAKGEAVLDPKIAGRVLRWAHKRRYGGGPQTLSVRETEVLRLVAKGESNKEIAAHLALTENTVKTYLRRALEKLNCTSRSEAAAAAAKRGLL
jgi:two-component system response regulator DevR